MIFSRKKNKTVEPNKLSTLLVYAIFGMCLALAVRVMEPVGLQFQMSFTEFEKAFQSSLEKSRKEPALATTPEAATPARP